MRIRMYVFMDAAQQGFDQSIRSSIDRKHNRYFLTKDC